MTLALGLMSGTSCDGISAALVRFERHTFHLIAYRTTPYPPTITQQLRRATMLRTAPLAQLNMRLGELFADAALRVLRAARTAPRRVAVIGSHGHTVYHGPNDATPCTLQLGEPAVIAHRTGVPVVANFRMRDLAAGGCGAPLIPFFDHYFFGSGAPRALQNIGGIANVTLVGRGLAPLAFDTGPGNCLLDVAMRRVSRGRLACDRGGRLAARGRVNARALARLLAHPYFRNPPPKSTGPEQFHEPLIASAFGPRWPARGPEVLATLTRLTAQSIADSYRRWLPVAPREVLVNGGGCLNRTLMRELAQALTPIPVRSIAREGLPPQAKEPVAFAFLGLRAFRGRVNHLPHTTGAARACVLGTLVRP
jgi:anhydro-N-acetylmuramic acid kinase